MKNIFIVLLIILVCFYFGYNSLTVLKTDGQGHILYNGNAYDCSSESSNYLFGCSAYCPKREQEYKIGKTRSRNGLTYTKVYASRLDERENAIYTDVYVWLRTDFVPPDIWTSELTQAYCKEYDTHISLTDRAFCLRDLLEDTPQESTFNSLFSDLITFDFASCSYLSMCVRGYVVSDVVYIGIIDEFNIDKSIFKVKEEYQSQLKVLFQKQMNA